MYIIVNKATFIVTENINPSIRNSKKSTINTTSLSQSIMLCYVKWKPHLFILIPYVYYYILIFIKKQANKTNFLFIIQFLASIAFFIISFLNINLFNSIISSLAFVSNSSSRFCITSLSEAIM